MTDRSRPLFARFYERVTPGMEDKGLARLRAQLLDRVTGDVVEVGPGNGMNFAHYPPTTTSVVAIEPEPHLRSLAIRATAQAPVPVRVIAGTAEALPLTSHAVDVGVVSLVMCALKDQRRGFDELFRVIRPGGELRFLEHVADDHWVFRVFQRLADATVWPMLTGGCRTARYPLQAMRDTGFEVTSVQRIRFPDGGVPVPAAPHVLGIAQRPAQ